MTCPACHGDTKVIDSRAVDDEWARGRVRLCLECGLRFKTIEIPIQSPRESRR